MYDQKGIDAALAHYGELKKKYYARGTLDFGERSLNEFGYDLLAKNDTAGAIKALTLNADQYPESPNVWDSLAEAYLKAGNKAMAERYYEKVLTLDPGSENAKNMLKEIRESSGK